MSLLRTAAKVSVATRVHGRAQRNQQQRWANQDQAAAAPAPAPAPVATAPASAGLSMDDKLAQLKQLGELRDAGILSEAEFEVKKHQVLNG
jgi:transposase-like protein